MSQRIVFSGEAKGDVAEAYQWYELRERGLGEEFLRCVEAVAGRIVRQPEMYPIAVDLFRRAPLRRFPFEVFYESKEQLIVIYAVFHCSQDPQKWRERLRLQN